MPVPNEITANLSKLLNDDSIIKLTTFHNKIYSNAAILKEWLLIFKKENQKDKVTSDE